MKWYNFLNIPIPFLALQSVLSMCFLKLNLSSSISPRWFCDDASWTSVAYFKRSGMKDIFHWNANLLIIFKSLLSSFENLVRSLTMEKTEVSLAKTFTLGFKPSAKSLIEIKNKSEPRMEPCRTPALMPCQSGYWSFKTTLCFLLDKKLFSNCKKSLEIPRFFSLYSKPSFHT